MAAAADRTGVTFYFDPGCPWTWLSSRWLMAAAQERDLDIRWRTFSLALLNKGKTPPAFLDTPDMRAKMALAAQALKVVEAAVVAGDNDGAGRFYTEFGTRFHVKGGEPSTEMLEESAAAAGVTHLVAMIDDPDIEAAVARSLEEAQSLSGPDVGSPVLHVDGAERGTFGPIVSPSPTGEEAGRLWDAVVALQGIGSFFELKRGRSAPPIFQPA